MKTLMAYPLPVCTGPNMPEWCATRNMSTDCFSRVPQKDKDRCVGFLSVRLEAFLETRPRNPKILLLGETELAKDPSECFRHRSIKQCGSTPVQCSCNGFRIPSSMSV